MKAEIAKLRQAEALMVEVFQLLETQETPTQRAAGATGISLGGLAVLLAGLHAVIETMESTMESV